MRKLTGRDKIIIAVLAAAAVIAVLLMLVVQPAYAGAEESTFKLAAAEKKAAEYSEVIGKSSEIRADFKEAKEQYDKAAGSFTKKLKKYELQKIAEELCADSAASLKGLTIGDYRLSLDAGGKPIGEGGQYLFEANMSIAVSGSNQNLILMCHAIDTFKESIYAGMSVTRFVLNGFDSSISQDNTALLSICVYAIDTLEGTVEDQQRRDRAAELADRAAEKELENRIKTDGTAVGETGGNLDEEVQLPAEDELSDEAIVDEEVDDLDGTQEEDGFVTIEDEETDDGEYEEDESVFNVGDKIGSVIEE